MTATDAEALAPIEESPKRRPRAGVFPHAWPMTNRDMNRLAAIVCRHVADGTADIRHAVRDVPIEDADSGWQFLCGANGHDIDDAEVWSSGTVARHEPSLVKFLHLCPATIAARRYPCGLSPMSLQ